MSKDEERRIAARRKKRLHLFLAVLIAVEDAWKLGIEGGGQRGPMKYPAVEISQKAFVRNQIAKVSRWRDASIQMLEKSGDPFPKGMSFFRDADTKLIAIENEIKRLLPDGSHTEHIMLITDALYMAFVDWQCVEQEKRREVLMLIKVLGTFSDHWIYEGAPLEQTAHDVYMATTKILQEDA